MKLLRPLFLVVLLVGGFWFVSSHLPPVLTVFPLRIPRSLERMAPALRSSSLRLRPLPPTTRGAEQYRVYKRVLPRSSTSLPPPWSSISSTARFPARPGLGLHPRPLRHVLTNFHVVEGANRGIEVMLSNKRRYAQRWSELTCARPGLLQIDAPNLQPVTLADSGGLSVGQKVYPSAIPSASAEP